jgi:hypothetical protein
MNAALNLKAQAKSVGKAIPEFKPVEIVLAGEHLLTVNVPTLLSKKQEILKVEHLGSLRM